MSEQDKALDNLMAWQQEFDKPVAWMQTFVNQDGDEKNFPLSWERIGVNDIPLYTAPRELSERKPVAWMTDDGKIVSNREKEKYDITFGDYCIPLYTAPKYKEPTTAEIMELWLDVINNTNPNDKRPHEWHFACALLKKASLR